MVPCAGGALRCHLGGLRLTRARPGGLLAAGGRGGPERAGPRLAWVNRRGVAAAVAGALVLVLGALVAVVRVPFVELGPGPVCNTVGRPTADCPSAYPNALIRISPSSLAHQHHDELFLTTVTVSPTVTLLTALAGWLSSSEAVVPRAVVFPPGQSLRQADREQLAQMRGSQDSATVAALAELGHVLVSGVHASYPAARVLRPGDEILAVDGRSLHTPGQLVSSLSGVRPGAVVRLTVLRSGQETTVAVPTVARSGQAVIGITVTAKPLSGVHVHVGLEGIGGPSAGLMLALGILDELSPQSLTGGLRVAGTGTIDNQGNVGPIGGIQQKMYAARHFEHAQVFLAPQGNCGEVRGAVPAGLRVVPVGTLDAALRVLAELRAGSTNLPSC